MTRKALALILLLLTCLAVAPAAADAASRGQIIKDCSLDDKLQGTYTASELRDARQNLPVDVLEYTSCVDVLRRAELALRRAAQATPAPGATAAPAGTPAAGTPADEPNGNDLPTQFDTPALAAAANSGDQAVDVGGVKLVPASGVRVDRSTLPDSLLVALAVLAAAGLSLAVPGVRNRLLRRNRG